jgi:hypothetical protein
MGLGGFLNVHVYLHCNCYNNDCVVVIAERHNRSMVVRSCGREAESVGEGLLWPAFCRFREAESKYHFHHKQKLCDQVHYNL